MPFRGLIVDVDFEGRWRGLRIFSKTSRLAGEARYKQIVRMSVGTEGL